MEAPLLLGLLWKALLITGGRGGAGAGIIILMHGRSRMRAE